VKGCLQDRKDDSAECGAGVRGKKGSAQVKTKYLMTENSGTYYNAIHIIEK
jgi:hypothetical protein